RVGGAEDIIVHGETGYLFEVGDKDSLRLQLQDLIYDPVKRVDWGSKARLRAEELNWDDIMRDFIYFYEDILREHGVETYLSPMNRPPSPLYVPKRQIEMAIS